METQVQAEKQVAEIAVLDQVGQEVAPLLAQVALAESLGIVTDKTPQDLEQAVVVLDLLIGPDH